MVLENCNLPYANHGHVILGDPSLILFYPISSTEIRCLVDVSGQKLPSLGNGDMTHYLKTVVVPQVQIILNFSNQQTLILNYMFQTGLGYFNWLVYVKLIIQVPEELQCSFVEAIDKGNIRSMPNRSMAACPYPKPGALLMGDAFNMRHPLTGGGMTVALSDIVLLRDLLRPLHHLHHASALCKYLESFYTLRKVNFIQIIK